MDRRPLRFSSGGAIRRLLLSPAQVRADVHDELHFHVEERVEELVVAGWAEAEAREHVLACFGNLERIEAECVELGLERIQRQRRTQTMTDLLQDLRYALRTFRTQPLFTLVAILTLGLGMGAATAVYTVVDRVALRDLPLHEPDRLYAIWETQPEQGIAFDNPSPPNLYDWRERTRSFEDLSAFAQISVTWTGGERPVALDGAAFTANLFPSLGIDPLLGRHVTELEERPDGARTALLSYEAWQDHFGGTEVLGQALTLNGQPTEIVGVLPPNLGYPAPGIDVWVPQLLADPNVHRQTRWLNVLGRLADGVSVEMATQEINRVHDELGQEYPDANGGWGVVLVPAKDQVVGDTGRLAAVVLAAVGLVLLIACANVASLLLGRTAARARELDIRAAIGASAGRLRRQLLTESIALGLAGGLVGLLVARFVLNFFLGLEPDIPRVGEVGIDLRILSFVVLGSILCAVGFGMAPARDAQTGGEGTLRGGRQSSGSVRTRRALVSSEVALSVVLLVTAGSFMVGFRALLDVDPGFDRSGIAAAKVSLNGDAYPDSDSRRQYFDQLTAALEALPGVSHAAVTSTLPMDPTGIDFDLARYAEGHPVLPEARTPQTDYRIITPGYIDAMGLDLLAGRDFTRFDRTETTPVMLITESLADALWPGESALGKHITLDYIQRRAWEVVGVLGDTRHVGLAVPPSQQMFVPLEQAGAVFGYMTVVVRGQGQAPLPLNRIRDVAAAVDPNEPLFQIETIEQIVDATVARDRLVTWAVGSLAFLALLLAAAGVYAVVSYQVTRRTREIGVRMALGATRERVVREVLTDAVKLALVGVVVGIGAAALATRVGQALVFGAWSWQPWVLVGVPALLLIVTALAAVAPALRAAGLDPTRAIRSD